MQCTDCKLQGVSCPYTFMVVPDGRVPDPCPYKTGTELARDFLDTTISGYMQVVYPEWNLEEVEKELRNFFDNMVKSVAENLRRKDPFNLDLVLKAEAQKFIEWVEAKHKGKDITTTLTTTSYTVGDENEKV